MVQRQLQKIFESESRGDWRSAYDQYRELYTRLPSQKVTIHFAFFCWYLLWQWDEISFPEEHLTATQRITTDERNGISRTELLEDLDRTTRRLLSDVENTPAQWLAVLVHMQRIYPYFFEKDTMSAETADRLLRYLEASPCESPGLRLLLAYQHDQEIRWTASEVEAVLSLFPRGSLIRAYFEWLFADRRAGGM